MKIRNAVLVGVVGIASVVGLPSAAAAQDAPALEIAGGYQLMRDFDIDESFPAGWFVSGAGSLTDNIAIVGEVAGSHKRDSGAPLPHIGGLFPDSRTDHDILTFLGGVRLRARSGPVIPFAQVLIGAARTTLHARATGFDASTTDTAFALQPGGGVDIPLSDNVAARAMVDYRRLVYRDHQDISQVRLAVGIVVGFGSR